MGAVPQGAAPFSCPSGYAVCAKAIIGVMIKTLLPLALLALSAPALSDQPGQAAQQSSLQQQVDAMLAAAPAGVRFGLLVVDEHGRTIVSVNPDQRFIPASSTKMFTTAAAFALLPGIDQPDAAGGARVALEDGGHGRRPDVVLSGRGDARMSSAPDCTVDCLATLADAVAARTRRVHDVIGDDTFWPDQRWVPGMSWNNIGTNSGTAVSALNLDDNELRLAVTPGRVGEPPAITVPPYFTLLNEARTVATGGKLSLSVERPVNSLFLRLVGEIPADAKGWSHRLGIDDPAHYAAWALKRLLEARGVRVEGAVQVRHRALGASGETLPEGSAPLPLAILTPPPLAEGMARINKDSQNLHAQALFRRLGQPATGEAGAVQAGRKLFEAAGLPPRGFEFSDGSGMSTYNRISPRATIALLRWVDSQPWAAAWHASLPVAGRDGTLRRRFLGTVLEGNLVAKTGTLNATNALSGTFRTAGGKRVAFAFFANDVPGGTSVLATMDAVLVRIAAVN